MLVLSIVALVIFSYNGSSLIINNYHKEKGSEQHDVQTTSPVGSNNISIIDISFGIGTIIATVENRGATDTTIDVWFSVSKGNIYPWIIGSYTVTVPAGKILKVSQEFNGLGFYDFHASYDAGDKAGYIVTRGFWFFIFGIEIGR